MTDTGSRTFYHGTRADLKPGDMLQGAAITAQLPNELHVRMAVS
jgi:hypothetical protein